jgi:hypothetical protein
VGPSLRTHYIGGCMCPRVSADIALEAGWAPEYPYTLYRRLGDPQSPYTLYRGLGVPQSVCTHCTGGWVGPRVSVRTI